jgi:NAD(P)-dependent dehydrogenase (short-subunit alcohol dehydrogenase family)
MLLEDTVSIITGGASGMGAASAELFASHGASVVVADVDLDGGRETVEAVEAAGGEATFVETDVSRAPAVRQMIETAVGNYGGLDVLYNNAGIEGSLDETAEEDETVFDDVLATNLRGVFLGMKYGIQAMLADGGGSIINTASVAAAVGVPGRVSYSGAKSGVVGMTRVAAVQYASEDIRVNAILPGIVDTPMIQRTAEARGGDADIHEAEEMTGVTDPSEVAKVAVFLGSDLSSRVTGIQVPVDGGLLAGA